MDKKQVEALMSARLDGFKIDGVDIEKIIGSGNNKVSLKYHVSANEDNLLNNMDSGGTTLANEILEKFNYKNGNGKGVENHNYTVWNYWRDDYYPWIIKPSYPVYIQERALDKGKQAFEIIKILKDKKLVKLEKVSDFIDLMDELIKIL